MSARRRLNSFLLLTGLLAGCATVLAPPREPIAPAARRGIDLLSQRWREFKDLRTLADVQVQRGRERQQVRAVVLARAPASVRFEALSPMGQPLLVATVHEGRLTTYDATTNEAFVGRATPETTARVLGLPFEPDDLVAVLAGRAIPPADVRIATWLPADDVGPSLELTGPVNRRRIWLDPETGVVRQLELSGGRGEARVRYLRGPAGVLTGFDVTAMMSYVTASVRYQNPTFDAAIDPAVFTFEPPADAKVQPLR